MATGIGSPLALGGLYPSVDGRYVAANGKPFTSVSNAESALNGFPSKLSESCIGLTVLVKESSWTKAKEYWVQPKGTTPETYGLVDKGAGTTEYAELTGKPSINGHELTGDMMAKDLGLVNQIQLHDGTAVQPDQNGNVKLPMIPQSTGEIMPDSTAVPTARAVYEALASKQDTLVSGTNIKTINNQSILGGGNITLPGCQCEVPFTTALRNKLNALPTITLNGNTIIINGTAFTLTPAGQGGDDPSEPDSFPTGVYLGTVSPAVTGFSSKSEALIASITAAHVKAAVAGGEMDKLENLPVTENNRASVTGGAKYGYLLALVPQSQNYVVKVYNGLTGYDPFGGNTGYYANGELTLTIDGTVYRLYGVYLAAAIEQNDPYFITISNN